MSKVRIPASQIDNYKTFCKAFSRNLEAGTGIRLRGNMLLNAIARAAGHEGHTALLMDAGVYGNGPFWRDLLPDQLATPLADRLELPPMQVYLLLADALVDAYSDEIGDATGETVLNGPLAGVAPAELPLPDPERSIWRDEFIRTDPSVFTEAGPRVMETIYMNVGDTVIGCVDDLETDWWEQERDRIIKNFQE